MKLYYSKGACSLVIRILINELGLDSEYESVNLRTKQTESGGDFLKINPKGAVPTLITDDGHTLTENAVIQQYIADTYQAYQLLPQVGDFKRYQILELLNFITTEIHKGFSPLFNPNLPQDIKEKIYIPQLKSKFKLLDNQLQQKKYLFGEGLTLPDIYCFVMLTWAHNFHLALDEYPNLARYYTDLQKRKAIQYSLSQEALETV
jgi:glutathione S-transferase